MRSIDINGFKTHLAEGYTVVDTRKPEDLAEGFCKGSIYIRSDENFINCFQELVESNQNVLLIADQSELAPLTKRINYAGISNIQGFLAGGFEVLKQEMNLTDLLITIDAEELAIDYRFDEFILMDVRSAEEFEKEHVKEAENIAAADIESLFLDTETTDSYYIYANSFHEALSAGSLLRRSGVERIKIVAEDYQRIKEAGIPIYTSEKKRKFIHEIFGQLGYHEY